MAQDSKLTDPYLQELAAQLKQLRSREAQLETKESEIRAEREAISREKTEIEVAARLYRAFIESKAQESQNADVKENESVDDGTAETMPTPSPNDLPQVTRVGQKRRAILEAISDAGPLTTREVEKRTGVVIDVVRNSILSDTKLGLLERRDQKVLLTTQGQKFLEVLRSNQSSPQTAIAALTKSARELTDEEAADFLE